LARLVVAVVLTILLSGFAGAEESPPAAPAVDEEKEVDEGLQRFGYLAGLARGCVADDQRSKLEREVLEMHAGIARLMGTDRAFLFASAYGYSTNIQIDVKECAEVLTNYDARVEKHRASQGSAK
jgi:hypothetical protein